MTPREPDERALRMRAAYEAGQTLQEIGDTYGITRERVRQILTYWFGFSSLDGGSHIRAEKRQKQKEAKRDARSLAKWGCTWEQRQQLSGRKLRAFTRQKNAARRRGIEWDMTLWQWWTIWQRSGHWEERGRGQGYVMCRDGDTGPYSPENVFIDTARANSSNTKQKRSDLPMGVSKISVGNYTAYVAQRMYGGQKYRLGTFPTPELAGAAYLAFEPPQEIAA